MSDDPGKMSCAEFQAQLPELIGSGANAADHLAAHRHVLGPDLAVNFGALADHQANANCAARCWPTLRPSPKLPASCSPW